MRILFLFYCLFFSLLLLAQENRYRFSQNKMGSPFHLIFYAKDSLQANRVANECFSLVDSLNNIYSDYLPTSELNLLSASAGSGVFMPVSPALYDILLLADEAWKKSKGRFDITIGPISRLWRKARREKRFPSKDSVNAAKEKVGWKKIVFNKKNHSAMLLQPDMQLDLGGIAAGYIAQKTVDHLSAHGIVSALVDASGDIVCSQPPPGKTGWTIGINQPNETHKMLEKNLSITNRSVSTSGDVYQFIEHNGKKYSHIISPKTGYGVTFQRNVTIIARDGTTADWMATACSILPLKKVKRLTKKMKAEFLITQVKNGQLKQFSSRNFRNYWQKTN